MSDVLIPDVPESVLATLGGQAARLGLSRTESLRRQLTQVTAVGSGTTRPQDWANFGERFADLGDADIMDNAWR
ncbi:MAG: antitoxin [Candidatus Nanopelagicales bacterium]